MRRRTYSRITSIHSTVLPATSTHRLPTSCHDVVLLSARKYVRPVISHEHIHSLAAKDLVDFLAAHQSVVASLAVKNVLAGLAQNEVIAISAIDLKKTKTKSRIYSSVLIR